MKAIVCQDFGPVENLRYMDVPDPRAKPGEVVIEVEAAGVNFPDALLVEGRYQIKPPTPFIPGSEVSGRISEVGSDVTHLKPGQRVVSVCTLGGFAEKVAVDARRVLPITEHVPAESAAGLLVAHATAHHALKQRGQLQEGETLLVTGAAGGTGLAAVQIGKAMGARVIAVCSSAEKLAVAADNGADILINSSDGDLVAQLKAAGGEKGVDVAYEVVGGPIFDACVRAMGWNGRLLVIGFAGGTIPQFPVNLALVKGISIVGVFWGSFTQHEPAAFASNMQELMAWYQQGKVSVVIDEVFPLADAVQAIGKITSRAVKGKIILRA